MDPASTRNFIRAQYAIHPAAQLQDMRKALHQSTFGCEHLILDVSAAAAGIREEYEKTGESRRDVERLDGPWSRIYLGVLADGLTPETLAAAFARSAEFPHEGADALEARVSVLLELVRAGELPYTLAETLAELSYWREAGFPACRHSETYRGAYHPAYRVLHTSYARLLPLLTAIDRGLSNHAQLLLAIEGGAASGKSTLAALLGGLYDANILHADDFFLRPEQRTAQRYAQPGGNLDRERLETEVLQPLRRGETAVYRLFDCHTLSFKKAVTVPPKRLNIVEGSYSFHPELAHYYDLSAFLCVTPETQHRRILARNGPEWGQSFFQRWIPMEEAYFRGADTPRRCNMILEEETL